MNTNLASVLRLADTSGRVILLFYAACTILVASLNLGGLIVPSLGILCLALLCAALAVLALPGTETLARVPTITVVGLGLLITLLSAWNLADYPTHGYAAWYLGAVTFLFLVLTLRGRRLVAWAAFSVFAILTITAATLTGPHFMLAIEDVARQAATLFIGTLFAAFLDRVGSTITAIQASQLRRARAEASASAATAERGEQNAKLARDARPSLERIIDPAPFSDDELDGFVLLEASLRDGIRAAGLSTDRISETVRAARARGLQVVLLDDRVIELDPYDRSRVEAALVAELEATRFGTITARLSPAGRTELATIVVNEVGNYRRVVVSESTTVTTTID